MDPIGSMYAIYGNIGPINIPPMLAYIPAPWILWGWSTDVSPMCIAKIPGMVPNNLTCQLLSAMCNSAQLYSGDAQRTLGEWKIPHFRGLS